MFDQKIAAGVDRAGEIVYDTENQTVEAEITAVTPLQRARGAESRVRNELSNGPLRAQSNAGGMVSRRVFCDVEAYVSCRGYDGILLSAREISREFEVAPRIIIILYDSSLTEIKICQGLFYCISKAQN